MTLRRGEDWGAPVAPPPGLIEIGWDANAAWSAGLDELPVRLTGGDLLTSLGGPSSGATVNRFPVDLLRIVADGDELVALAHVIARGRTWWRGPVSAVFNADHLGRWDAVPKAHPGDGRFDVVEVDGAMPLRARWQVWRRLPTGTHLPHPMVHVRQADAMTWEFTPPRRLWVDGVAHGAVHRLEVTMSSEGVVVYT